MTLHHVAGMYIYIRIYVYMFACISSYMATVTQAQKCCLLILDAVLCSGKICVAPASKHFFRCCLITSNCNLLDRGTGLHPGTCAVQSALQSAQSQLSHCRSTLMIDTTVLMGMLLHISMSWRKFCLGHCCLSCLLMH